MGGHRSAAVASLWPPAGEDTFLRPRGQPLSKRVGIWSGEWPHALRRAAALLTTPRGLFAICDQPRFDRRFGQWQHRQQLLQQFAFPMWSKADTLASLEAATSSTRGGWLRLLRAPGTVAGRPVARPLPIRVARPEAAQEPKCGTACGERQFDHAAPQPDRGQRRAIGTREGQRRTALRGLRVRAVDGGAADCDERRRERGW